MGKILLDIPDSLHQEIKILAAKQKAYIKDLAVKAITEYLGRNKKEKE